MAVPHGGRNQESQELHWAEVSAIGSAGGRPNGIVFLAPYEVFL